MHSVKDTQALSVFAFVHILKSTPKVSASFWGMERTLGVTECMT